MAASSVPDSDLKVTWSQKLTDFTFVLKSGKHLEVHKHVLAENSEAFEAMLTQEFEESKNNQMSMLDFEDKTVFSFIEYLYADSRDPKTIKLIRAGIDPEEYIYKRSFEPHKLTVDLLKIAHMYGVEDLKTDCTEHLKKNISDDNVMEIWMAAETMENTNLSSTAMKHLVERPQGKSLLEVPGFNESFQSHEKHLRDLLGTFSEERSRLKQEICKLQAELKDIRHQIIKVTVIRGSPFIEWTEEFYVSPTELISSIILKLQTKRGKALPLDGHLAFTLSDDLGDEPVRLHVHKTFEENGIRSDTSLFIWYNQERTILI